MTSTAAPSFIRSADGYAVWLGETLIGRVERDGRRWSAITVADVRLGDTYSTRAEAASALAVTARRIAEVEAIADAAEPPAVVTVERLVADTLHLGYRSVADYLAAPGREVGQVTPWTLDRAERAVAREHYAVRRGTVRPGSAERWDVIDTRDDRVVSSGTREWALRWIAAPTVER